MQFLIDNLNLVSTLAETIYRVVAAVAIVIGGGWAYLKYVRGRTFTERLEIFVDGYTSVISGVARVTVSCDVSNVGTRKVHLKKDDSIVAIKALALQAHSPQPDSGGSPKITGASDDNEDRHEVGAWVEVNRQAVFEEIELLEPGESANDAALIQVPQAENPLGAIKLELNVYSAKTAKGWSAKKVVINDT